MGSSCRNPAREEESPGASGGGCCGTAGALKGSEVADSGSSGRSPGAGPPGLGQSLAVETLEAAGCRAAVGTAGGRAGAGAGAFSPPAPWCPHPVLPAGRASEGAAAEQRHGQPGSGPHTAEQAGAWRNVAK